MVKGDSFGKTRKKKNETGRISTIDKRDSFGKETRIIAAFWRHHSRKPSIVRKDLFVKTRLVCEGRLLINFAL